VLFLDIATSWAWHTCTNTGHLTISHQLLVSVTSVNIITNIVRTHQLHSHGGYFCVQVPPPLEAVDVDLLTSGGVVPAPGSMVPDMQTEIVVQSSPPSMAL
jgi:hypothetical protein